MYGRVTLVRQLGMEEREGASHEKGTGEDENGIVPQPSYCY